MKYLKFDRSIICSAFMSYFVNKVDSISTFLMSNSYQIMTLAIQGIIILVISLLLSKLTDK
ncbi:hypothetical protein CSC2_06590 [Clostridium zeae]|uniref:Uncharacterized protein n=1 Tax=Clostridium zeae TaxID=2759022 RepID=A0ABQ1E5X9_9CLOT|nr:hypothetical protein [Clostridium zeae]GFZ30133.1 hypothetical protein CSC2_06590 [Clostridium zeae]